MSSTIPGRHRAPRSLSMTQLARPAAALVASGGLLMSLSGGAHAAPAAAPPTANVAAALPATPGTLAAKPFVSHPATPGSWSSLRVGSRGGTVASIQRIVGAYPDGVFGPRTRAAVQRWQSANGLVADGIVGPLTSRAMGLTGSSSQASDTSGVLAYAQQYTGITYRWGGTSPATGFDCSGYTQFVFAKIGVELPRTAEAQRQFATPVSDPRPGDLVFWGAPAWHMAIYAGDGMIYDSGRTGYSTQKRQMFPGVTSYGRVG